MTAEEEERVRAPIPMTIGNTSGCKQSARRRQNWLQRQLDGDGSVTLNFTGDQQSIGCDNRRKKRGEGEPACNREDGVTWSNLGTCCASATHVRTRPRARERCAGERRTATRSCGIVGKQAGHCYRIVNSNACNRSFGFDFLPKIALQLDKPLLPNLFSFKRTLIFL